jgi:hypothetical protein
MGYNHSGLVIISVVKNPIVIVDEAAGFRTLSIIS